MIHPFVRRLIAACSLVAIAAAGASAQNHVHGYAAATTGGNLYLVDSSGITTMQAGTSTCYGCVMDENNSLLLVTNSNGSIYQVDPATKTVVGTLVSGLGSLRDIAVGQNGFYYVVASSFLYRVDSAGGVTTITSALSAGSHGGMDIDIDSGALLIQDSFGIDALLRVTRDGASITTIGTGFDARYGIAQHIPTGDVFSGSCCGDQSPPENLFRLANEQPIAAAWLSTSVAPVGVYSLRADRASSANQQLILGALGSSAARGQGLYRIDVESKQVTKIATITTSLYETEILYRRNLSSVQTGRGQWSLQIRIPEDPGLAYLIAPSATGVRPGLLLADGRQINLRIDNLTIAAVQFGLAPILTGIRGSLNAQGLGVAQFDLSGLGSAVNGIRFYFGVITFDPSAPLGIKTITDPIGLTAEGV